MGATGICNRRPKEATCPLRRGGLGVEGWPGEGKVGSGQRKAFKATSPNPLCNLSWSGSQINTGVPLSAQQQGVSASREPAHLTQACTSAPTAGSTRGNFSVNASVLGSLTRPTLTLSVLGPILGLGGPGSELDQQVGSLPSRSRWSQ